MFFFFFNADGWQTDVIVFHKHEYDIVFNVPVLPFLFLSSSAALDTLAIPVSSSNRERSLINTNLHTFFWVIEGNELFTVRHEFYHTEEFLTELTCI